MADSADITEYGLAGYSLAVELLAVLLNKRLLSVEEARAMLGKSISSMPPNYQAGIRTAFELKLNQLKPF
jgi:hypothetical protein